MNLSKRQIDSVIRTYVKNLKARVSHGEGDGPKDDVVISREGMKLVVFERIEEKTAERAKGIAKTDKR